MKLKLFFTKIVLVGNNQILFAKTSKARAGLSLTNLAADWYYPQVNVNWQFSQNIDLSWVLLKSEKNIDTTVCLHL